MRACEAWSLRRRQHRHLRVEQARGERDLDVDVVVAGERQHAGAMGAAEAGQHQRHGIAGVACERGHAEGQVVHLHRVDALGNDVDHHHARAVFREFAGHAAAGVVVAADQVERLADAAHRALHAVLVQDAAKQRVLQDAEQGTDAIQPGHHRAVDRRRGPQALRVGEGVGDFAQADGGAQEADEIERMQKAHAPGLSVGRFTGNQGEAQHGHGVDADEHHQRLPQAAQQDEDAVAGAVAGRDHRRAFSGAGWPFR